MTSSPSIYPVFTPKWDEVLFALGRSSVSIKISCYHQGGSQEFLVDVDGLVEAGLSVSAMDNNLWWVDLYVCDEEFDEVIGRDLPIMLVDFDRQRGFLLSSCGLSDSSREELELMIDKELFDNFRHEVISLDEVFRTLQPAAA